VTRNLLARQTLERLPSVTTWTPHWSQFSTAHLTKITSLQLNKRAILNGKTPFPSSIKEKCSPFISTPSLQLSVGITIDRPIVESPRKFVAIVTHGKNKMHSLTHNKLGMTYRIDLNRTLRSWNFDFRLFQDYHQLCSTQFHTRTQKITTRNQCSNTNWFKY
jgi:hypothetical protein